jgi:aminopeptidase-like protein
LPESESGMQTAARAVLWALNFSEGTHSRREIAERSQFAFAAVAEGADTLRQKGLSKNVGAHLSDLSAIVGLQDEC